MPDAQPAGHRPTEYVVVARRYRPQRFEDLVGQTQIAHALTNAIATNRVGHAYLFTGARGVGKTSTARILAKALNCVRGPTPVPCNECDVCLGVASGEDLDVIEIDGASNRGIDEIRQLRSNVNVRPSRARFKIYIIDEVHMLTMQAFNALLKTLEEPPEHVKFIFCTTDVEKIPITVLSRCQRFDFPPVETKSILERLQFVVDTEGATAEPEALRMLARRAAGSLRDSQSLLEQLLAFSSNSITVDSVHRMLGTIRGGNLAQLVNNLLARDAAATLQAIDQALHEGVDAGQLAEQLLGYYRDVLAATVGCDPDLMLNTLPVDFQHLQSTGQKLGLETILATMQILDQAMVRMRQSMHSRTLLEVAIVRICSLEKLDDLARLIGKLESGLPVLPSPTPAQMGQEKKNEIVNRAGLDSVAAPAAPPEDRSPAMEFPLATPFVLSIDTARTCLESALSLIDDMTADFARFFDDVAILAPDRLALRFRNEYNLQKQACERPDRKAKLEQAVAQIVGRPIQLAFETSASAAPLSDRRRPVNRRQRMREMESHPLVEQAKRLFEAEVIEVTGGRPNGNET